MPSAPPAFPDISRALLAWFDRERRVLPWRALPGTAPDPWHVLLSEFMLQQTTVTAVTAYFSRFIRLWPTLQAFAAADPDTVLAAWSGLGYYTRARNLHRTAQILCGRYGGQLPGKQEELRALPGIGPCTEAALRAILRDEPVAPVDGNWKRVLSRLFCIDRPLAPGDPELAGLAARLMPPSRAGDLAQAVMDLGAMVCRRTPLCDSCPLASLCRGRQAGLAARLPRLPARRKRPVRHGRAFVLMNARGEVLLRRQPPGGLLGDMFLFPGSGPEEADTPPPPARDLASAGHVRHEFTHLVLCLEVMTGSLAGESPRGRNDVLARPARFGSIGFPALSGRIWRLASAAMARESARKDSP